LAAIAPGMAEGPQVRFDADGNALFNGKPFFLNNL
jgi:hypothetical protein